VVTLSPRHDCVLIRRWHRWHQAAPPPFFAGYEEAGRRSAGPVRGTIRPASAQSQMSIIIYAFYYSLPANSVNTTMLKVLRTPDVAG
jgi:hypothetical protein